MAGLSEVQTLSDGVDGKSEVKFQIEHPESPAGMAVRIQPPISSW